MLTKVDGKVSKELNGPIRYHPPVYTLLVSTFLVIALYLIPYSIGSTVPTLIRTIIKIDTMRQAMHPTPHIIYSLDAIYL